MTSSSFVKDHMLIDPSMQKEIIRRALDGNLGDNPNQAVHSLGTVKTPDGREVAVHLRHAAAPFFWTISGVSFSSRASTTPAPAS